MSNYPECDRLAEASKATQPIGEFLDWLESQGIQLMVYREDLEDIRPTGERCSERSGTDRPDALIPCKPTSAAKAHLVAGADYWSTHCLHWHDPEREREPGRPVAGYVTGTGEDWRGICCWCGKGREYTVITRGWVHEERGFEQLLADWAGIDLKKVDAERRQMLASLREANAAREG